MNNSFWNKREMTAEETERWMNEPRPYGAQNYNPRAAKNRQTFRMALHFCGWLMLAAWMMAAIVYVL